MNVKRAVLVFLAVLITVFSCNCFAGVPGKAFPFTEEEDLDGARMVWFLMNISGLKATKHAYIPINEIPKSNRWLKLKPDEPLQQIDMVWWPNAVAILTDTENKLCRFKAYVVPLKEFEKRFGKPEFRRFNTAEKPLALVVFDNKRKEPAKIPAILPETDLYAAIFDLAINATGPRCTHNPDDVWVSIADTDEKRVYEIDHSGCITSEQRKVDTDFFNLIKEMQKKSAFN
jgi:hypothetical protein